MAVDRRRGRYGKRRFNGYTLVLFIGLALIYYWQEYRLDHRLDALGPWAGHCVHIVDGDTVDVRLAGGDQERVRIRGVDCAETHNLEKQKKQAAAWRVSVGRVNALGREATAFTTERLRGRDVVLVLNTNRVERDPYDRLLAYVEVDGRDLGAALLRAGLAEARREPHPRKSDYAVLAKDARRAGRGLYAGR